MCSGESDPDGKADALGLDWGDGDMPYSHAFGDHFHARHDGLGETRHVFLAGNGLPERWTHRENFTIAELGFGTGLNLLATWQSWTLSRMAGQSLTYVAFEAWPLTATQIARANMKWPELAPLSTALIDRLIARAEWQSIEEGWQEVAVLSTRLDDQTQLVLHIGDANRMVPSWRGQADAWYLDGFAPSRNPDMWSLSLMAEVGKHTVSGGTFATYAAAGWVRRNLASAGFSVEKRKGFRHKREMTAGTMS